jgi:hypothetical protein
MRLLASRQAAKIACLAGIFSGATSTKHIAVFPWLWVVIGYRQGGCMQEIYRFLGSELRKAASLDFNMNTSSLDFTALLPNLASIARMS